MAKMFIVTFVLTLAAGIYISPAAAVVVCLIIGFAGIAQCYQAI
jgi:hypothetical protein